MPQTSRFELALVATRSAPAPRDGHARRQAGTAGPGWFESSWELRRGLEVKEDCCEDDRLDAWIAAFLQSQRTAGRTASPSASTAIA